MLSPKVKLRELKVEDHPDPCQPSAYYLRHLEFFGINPEEKTIKTVVIEMKTRVKESFIRKCHYLPESYDFKNFRLTRTYRLHRELTSYLLKLSSWLYRGGKFPPSLKKAFSAGNTFVNPYRKFSLDQISQKRLSLLNNHMLCVAFNLNVCSRLPDHRLRKSILKEMRNRNLEVSEIEESRNMLVELVKYGKRDLVILLQEDRD